MAQEIDYSVLRRNIQTILTSRSLAGWRLETIEYKEGRYDLIFTDDPVEVTVSGPVTVSQPIAITDNSGSLTVDGSVSVSNFPVNQQVNEKLENTFYIMFDAIAPATNKYMATLFNTSSTRKVVVQRLHRFNWQTALVDGIVLEQYITKISARTAGSSIPVYSMDSNDTLSSGISADTNSSSVTESHIIRRMISTNEELTITEKGYGFDTGGVIYERQLFHKGITLRQNQGISVRNVTNSTVGGVSYLLEFTDEPA